MAAIGTIWNSGAFTGLTNVGGTITDVSGNATPSVPGTTSSMVWDTAITEVNSSTSTVGSQARITINGGLEVGSKVRVCLAYVDINNYTFAEMEKGGMVIFTDLANDRVRLGKRESGVDRYLTGAPLLHNQQDDGDMRHYRFVAGSTLSIHKIGNIYIAKASMEDPIDGRDAEDLIVAYETDGAFAAVTQKAMFQLVGSSHTNSIGLFQGGTLTAHFTKKTGADSGSSPVATGSNTNPYLTIGKLMVNTAVNQIGFIGVGTYNENVGSGGAAPNNLVLPNGTGFQDAPTIMSIPNETVTQTCTGVGAYYIIGTATYRVLYGWTMDGQLLATNVIKLWGQKTHGLGQVAKYLRFQQLAVLKANTGGNIEFNRGTYPDTTAAQAIDYEEYHHVIDCLVADGNSNHTVAQGTHGFYVETSYNVVEYTTVSNMEGDGLKFFFGTATGQGGVQIVHHNIMRYCVLANNGQYSCLLSSGTGNICHSTDSKDATVRSLWLDPPHTGQATTSAAVGISIGYGAHDCLAYNNIVHSNAQSGITLEGKFGAQSTNSVFINNTSYGNKYNYLLFTAGAGTGRGNAGPDGVHWINNAAYGFTGGSAGGDYKFKDNSSYTDVYPGNATNVTYSHNHATNNGAAIDTADSWISNGGVTGNPQFNGAGIGDFTLANDTSVLIGHGTDPTAYFDGSDYYTRPIQSDGPVIGAFHFPDPFVAIPVNQLLATYNLTINVAGNLNISVVHQTSELTGTATSEAGVWLKTDNPGHVVITGADSGTGKFIHE